MQNIRADCLNSYAELVDAWIVSYCLSHLQKLKILIICL